MRKKRFKSIVAMILTASMILGSQVNAAGTEIGAGASAETGQEVTVENGQGTGAEAETGNGQKTGADAEAGNGQKTGADAETGNDQKTGGNAETGSDQNTVSEAAPAAGNVSQGNAGGGPVKDEKAEDKAPAAVSSDESKGGAVSEDAAVSGNKGVSADAVPGVSEETEDEEAAGTTVSPNLFVSGNTVSYNGGDQKITISMNLLANDGSVYLAQYRIISANDLNKKDPKEYKDSFSSDKAIPIDDVTKTAAEYVIENTKDAGRYAVSVDMVSINTTSLSKTIVSNNIVFLTVKQAGAVTVSVDGTEKFYDGNILKASDKKPYVVPGKGELFGDDLNKVTVSGELKDAGTRKIDVDVSAISKNYDSITVSSGVLKVLSTNLVITSRDFFKHYDGKRVLDSERKGFKLSSADKGLDIKTLSGNLKWDNDSFEWDPSSLISGDQVSASANKFKLKSDKLNAVSKNFASITYKFGTITVKKHVWTSNNLTAPVITSVKLNNKGWITINFKASKVYKNSAADDKRKNQARYFIYRYDDELQDWICLNGNNTADTNASGKKKKAEEIEFGQTGRSFVDKQAGRLGKSTYIYRVNVIGYDESGSYGMNKNTSDNYKMCQAIPLEVGTRQKDPKSIDFEFSKIRGAASYYIEKSSTNRKDSWSELTTVSASSKFERPYSGNKLVSAKSFNDKGQVITGEKIPAEAAFYTDSPVPENTYLFYRVKAIGYVTDFDESGKMLPSKIKVESDMSVSLKGKNGVRPPEILSSGSASYNQATIVFERLSSDELPIGDDRDFAKNKYQIMRSTKVDGGYSVVKTVTGRQLAGDIGDISDFYFYKKGQLISMNKLNYIAEKDCYAVNFKNVKPEYTYYFKVRAVRNNVVGTPGNYMTVKPVLNDVKKIDATSKNYNQVSVSTDLIPGATQMVITYRALKDHRGNVISENSCKEGTWVSKVFGIKKDAKTKKPVMEFVVGGLKHGYTYVFYAEPKYGRKHDTADPVMDSAVTKPGKVTLKASPKSLTEVYVQWASIPGATQYKLEIFDAEDTAPDRKPVKEQYFKSAGKHTWKGGNNGVIDGKTKASDLSIAGKPYTFRVTAYRKDSFFKEGYGNEGDASDDVTEAGRPQAVANLKAAVNSFNADAKLTWNACKDNTKDTPITYVIEREVYKFNVNTSNTFAKESVSSSLFDYKSNYKKLAYSSTAQVIGKVFNNGDKVVYKVIPVFNSGIKGRGQNKDGYIMGVPAKVTYITPYAITITARNELTVGETKTVAISFKPTSTTVKSVNWSAVGNNDYFTQNGANITGKNSSGDWNNGIYVQAISKANGIASNTGLVKVNAKAVSTSLKVCIDAGHGGEDSGATHNGLLEKNCNLEMAQAMRSRLESYGIPVVMTRTGDSYLTVGSRPEVAYNNGCNLFISIHCNSGGGKGTEVYKSITQYHDDDLASRIMGKITGTIGTANRGVKTRTGQNGDYYGVIRGAASRGINGMIVEVAFMDGDYPILSNGSNRQAAGTAIADAVLEKYGYK